jgi:lysophospholipase L1-like esterase
MLSSDRSPPALLGTIGVVCLALVIGCLTWLVFTRDDVEMVSVEPFTPAPETPLKQPVAVFLGDSYTQPGIWPGVVAEARGWKMVNLASGGTGYVARSTGKTAQQGCGRSECRNFVEMADAAIKREPDVVVVAGGRNDHGRSIDKAAHELFHTLRDRLPNARIIAVQPMWDASAYPDFLARYAKVIKKEVEAVDGEYVEIGNPLAKQPELMQPDGVHPTWEGQVILGRAVNKALGQT